jgi:hypothetical protein
MTNKKERYVRICPKCGSIDVHTDFSNPVVWASGTTIKYQCNSCKNMGIFFPEISIKKIKEYQQKIQKKKITKKHDYPLIDGTTGETAASLSFLGLFFIIGAILFFTGIFSNISIFYKIILIFGGILLWISIYYTYKELKKEASKK